MVSDAAFDAFREAWFDSIPRQFRNRNRTTISSRDSTALIARPPPDPTPTRLCNGSLSTAQRLQANSICVVRVDDGPAPTPPPPRGPYKRKTLESAPPPPEPEPEEPAVTNVSDCETNVSPEPDANVSKSDANASPEAAAILESLRNVAAKDKLTPHQVRWYAAEINRLCAKPLVPAEEI